MEASLIIEKPLDAPMLDLGCGDGVFSSTLFDEISVGLDALKENLRKTRKLKVYGSVLVADAAKMPFKNGTFRSVLSNSVMEHIPNCDYVLDEVHRILKEGGTFVFTVPSDQFNDLLFIPQFLKTLKKLKTIQKIIDWYVSQRNRSLLHFNLLSASQWRRKLEIAGLKPVEINYYLTSQTMLLWDCICVASNKLRLSFLIRLVPRKLLVRIFNCVCDTRTGYGGALLITARKY